MTRIVLIILAALVAAAPASAKERSFILGGFERIVVEGDIVVHITTGVSPSAAADGTLDQLDRVRLVRNGNMVTAKLLSPVRTSGNDRSDSGPLVVNLSTRRLAEITTRGNGVVTADAMEDRTVRIFQNGSGQVTVGRIDADMLYLNLVGAGSLTINGGTAREGQAQLTGAVRWRAPDLMLDRLDLTHSGPATSAVMVDEFARITNNGTGQIDIGGTADCDIRSTGSARIVCGNGENFRQR